MLRLLRRLHTNIVLRMATSLVLVAVLDFLVLITGMPVVTCVLAVYRDGATPWLLLAAQGFLAFSVWVVSYPASGLMDLWRGEGLFQEFPNA